MDDHKREGVKGMARDNGPLTTGEVAKICGVSPRLVTMWLDKDLIKGWRLPGSKDRRFARRDVAAFMTAHGFERSMIPDARDRPVVLAVGCRPGVLSPSCGFEVHRVASAFDAGVAFAELRPDCVLVDSAIGRIDAGMIAASVRGKAVCAAIADLGVFDAFDATIPPGLGPADVAERLRIVFEAADERKARLAS